MREVKSSSAPGTSQRSLRVDLTCNNLPCISFHWLRITGVQHPLATNMFSMSGMRNRSGWCRADIIPSGVLHFETALLFNVVDFLFVWNTYLFDMSSHQQRWMVFWISWVLETRERPGQNLDRKSNPWVCLFLVNLCVILILSASF